MSGAARPAHPANALLDDERGDVEDVPVIVALLIILVALGAFLFILAQYSNANTQVQAAAFAAARDVSLAGTAEGAQGIAYHSAQQSLAGNISCTGLDVQVDDSGLHTALGQTGSVTATVTCRILFRTMIMPGMPGAADITKTASSPTDPYRERNG